MSRLLNILLRKQIKGVDFLYNNFRVILAKKKMKMSDVIAGTGLSKNTVRALYYETAKGIQFETLDKLCIFLQCEVGDLFELEKEEAV